MLTSNASSDKDLAQSASISAASSSYSYTEDVAAVAAQTMHAPPATFPIGGTPVAASLYVGELAGDVTVAMLFEIFSKIGPVVSIRICRDSITRKSLGYAYVNYHDPVSAEHAIETLNYLPINGKPCRIMWSQRDPSIRKTGAGNIFIKNLAPTVDNKALHDTFSAFGKVLSCKILATNGSDNSPSKGLAFVHFEQQSAADQAVQQVNGMMLEGRIVSVSNYITRAERLPRIEAAKAQFTNVFVKNIEPAITDEDFEKAFASFGKITSAKLERDAKGASKGFGFVCFETHEAASSAVTEMHGKQLGKKEVYVARAQSKDERARELKSAYGASPLTGAPIARSPNLYVKNLADEVDEKILTLEFSPYGTITSIAVMRDEKGISKGVAFISLKTMEEASEAIAKTNGKMLCGKPLYVALAQTKAQRKALLEQQYSIKQAYQPAVPYFYQQATAERPSIASYAEVPVSIPPISRSQPPARIYQGAVAYPSQVSEMAADPSFNAGNGRPNGVRHPGSTQRPSGRVPQQQLPGATQYSRHGNGSSARSSGGRFQSRSLAYPPRSAQANLTISPNTVGFNPATLAAASPEQQKQILGNALFPIVSRSNAELAPRITGMLLEMDNGEILHLFESPEALQSKITEAVELIAKHSQQSQ